MLKLKLFDKKTNIKKVKKFLEEDANIQNISKIQLTRRMVEGCLIGIKFYVFSLKGKKILELECKGRYTYYIYDKIVMPFMKKAVYEGSFSIDYYAKGDITGQTIVETLINEGIKNIIVKKSTGETR